jgi:hypothetical protein
MSEEASAQNHRARVFYHWKKPGAKERHGFAMGMVSAQEKTAEGVIAALKEQHEKLREFDIFIDKLEWR